MIHFIQRSKFQYLQFERPKPPKKLQPRDMNIHKFHPSFIFVDSVANKGSFNNTIPCHSIFHSNGDITWNIVARIFTSLSTKAHRYLLSADALARIQLPITQPLRISIKKSIHERMKCKWKSRFAKMHIKLRHQMGTKRNILFKKLYAKYCIFSSCTIYT